MRAGVAFTCPMTVRRGWVRAAAEQGVSVDIRLVVAALVVGLIGLLRGLGS